MIVSDHSNVRSMNCGVIQCDQYRKFIIIVVIRKNILEYPKNHLITKNKISIGTSFSEYKRPKNVKKIYINYCFEE